MLRSAMLLNTQDGQTLAQPQNDGLLLTACDLKQHFVIEAQSELRHSRQHHFQLDGSNNFTPQDAAIGAHLGVKGGS